MAETIGPVCVHCNNSIGDPRYYVKHLQMHLKDGETNPKIAEEIERVSDPEFHFQFQCRYCDALFKSPYSLRYHQLKVCLERKTVTPKLIPLIEFIRTTNQVQDLSLLISEIRTRALEIGTNEEVRKSLLIHDKKTDALSAQADVIDMVTLTGFGNEDSNSLELYLPKLKELLRKLMHSESIDLYKQIFTGLFSNTYCCSDYKCNYNLYVSNNKIIKPFYIFKDDVWKKNGNLEDLVKVYENLVALLKKTLKAILKKDDEVSLTRAVIHRINLDYHVNKGKNSCIGRQLAKEFHAILYDNRENIKVVFSA